jgi:sporulation protein YlmC with PRC-barrel domain
MHRDGELRASKLIGIKVYNEANVKIGDIHEVILDKSGKVANVVLGVGGFLGAGEYFVAVAYDKLQWVNEPRSMVATSANAPADGSSTNEANNARTAAEGNPPTAIVAATSTTNYRSANKHRYPDHAVLSATKEELKSMPEFKY